MIWSVYAGFVKPNLKGVVSHSPNMADVVLQSAIATLTSNISIRAHNRKIVLACLVDGEATAPEIAASIGLTEKTTRLVLHDLLAEHPPKVAMRKEKRVSVFSLVERDCDGDPQDEHE